MLIGAVAFLLVIVAFMAIPVSLTFRASWPQTFQGYLILQWAFGLVRVQIPMQKEEAPSLPDETRADKVPCPRHPSRHKPNVMAALRQQRLRRRIIRYIGDCWHAVHKRDLQLRLRIGLDDPADTGQLWAIMGPVAALLANNKEALFEIEADFYEEIFELDGSGNVEFVPLKILYLTLAMLLSPAIWQGIKQLRKVG